MSDDLIKRLDTVEITAVRANRELLGTKPITQVNADVREAAARIRELEAEVKQLRQRVDDDTEEINEKRFLPETHDRLTADEIFDVFGGSVPVKVCWLLTTPSLEGPLYVRRAINRILAGEGE